MGYGKLMATFFCGVHTVLLSCFWGSALGVRYPVQKEAKEPHLILGPGLWDTRYTFSGSRYP
ncbi:MAG TPA: hypothetical protein DEF18_02220 [Muricauda sp.]|nr:hypothetical protein [Allomuricauda sp.]